MRGVQDHLKRLPQLHAGCKDNVAPKSTAGSTNDSNSLLNSIQEQQTPSVSDLAGERSPVQRFYEVRIHLVGSEDDGGHSILVLWRRGGEERQGCQRDVVLAAGQTTFIVAVRAQAVRTLVDKNQIMKFKTQGMHTGE